MFTYHTAKRYWVLAGIVKPRVVHTGVIPFVGGAGKFVTCAICVQVGVAIVTAPERDVALYHSCNVLLASAVLSQVETPFSKTGNGLVFSMTNVTAVFVPAPLVAL